MSEFYTPYREKYGANVVKHYIHLNAPLKGYADSKELSKNLTLGEIRKSSFVKDDEKNLFAYVPIDTRVIQAFQILRDALGSPVTVNSSFRSVRYEISRKRTGESQHTYGKALDLSGVGLVELLTEALETKNKLYQRLRNVGVNAFGIYVEDNFIHIDVREPKIDGGYALWFGGENEQSEEKKKSFGIMAVLTVLGIVLSVVGLVLRFKDWRR
ncbi:D-Ala-D-Ala carboxypeptidase family metallohydrolase [Tenacibaculum soleae]|uniref:D-Ala-D-Ala carboxypeptidase family metallohydrolase n=1 Tax=Tenacibaculum soleae TaxID=447689 RepID=UPI002300F57B|nr:D-Ala-D-Ala carboxypeptidase family metallohydrolase [Tenacibaculum soleae]